MKIEADAVSYNGMYPHIDTVCAMLESGKHVVLTAGFVYPQYLGAEVAARLQAACIKGKCQRFCGGIGRRPVQ